MSQTLMVGVSGVRGVVGRDLTPEVVARWAAAFGRWARLRRPLVVVGRDSRESGPAFAAAASAGLAAAGCEVIELGLAATPTIQLAVEYHGAGGGIAVTASHNPIEWNALKFIGPDGIFLDGPDGARVAALAAEAPAAAAPGPAELRYDARATERHVVGVVELAVLDAPRIRRAGFKVALDAVRGAGGPLIRPVLERLGCSVMGMNLEPDGRFPRPPEPVPQHLGALAALVRSAGANVGLAVDPDGDRLALVDERGEAIGEDYTLAFAVRAVLGAPSGGGRETSGGAGRSVAATQGGVPLVVVCNLSTSLVVEDAAQACGASLVRTPVGEAHVARQIKALAAPIGGEGNGGVMYPALHVGRDAAVAAALVLALLARDGRTVSELVAAAPRYAIIKAHLARGGALEPVYAALRRRFPDAALDTQDGLRLAWPGRWLHVRPSNTEPIIRLIAEAPTRAAAEHLVDEGRRVCVGS